MAITSPPYGESDSAKLRDKYVPGMKQRESLYNQHEDKAEEWGDLLQGSFLNMQEFSESQFVNIQMLAQNKRRLVEFVSDNIGNFVDVVVWDKITAPPQMAKNILNNQFEFVFIFSNTGNTRAIPFGDFHGNVNNIIRFTHGNNEYADVHRAVFPVEFPATIMKIASKAETVLDLFGGTGTTLIACEQMGKQCFMSEIDPKYVDLIIERWENFTGEKAILLAQGE